MSGHRHTLAILHMMNAISVFIVVGPRYARCAQSTAISAMRSVHCSFSSMLSPRQPMQALQLNSYGEWRQYVFASQTSSVSERAHLVQRIVQQDPSVAGSHLPAKVQARLRLQTTSVHAMPSTASSAEVWQSAHNR